ncbi:efflux RND transporter periplasmic adaptor subunit [Polymorphobacter multimanifer]|uniref:efflux RND transporter periplasmic adaptor subunit n=1 Tax=Polymorphobacter multimanifer TaxID=1070431 RepID=UPI00166AEF4B|nr:efflux RND transporter periplasmic adaptor subunit [Polymorphobacter multimanifer]
MSMNMHKSLPDTDSAAAFPYGAESTARSGRKRWMIVAGVVLVVVAALVGWRMFGSEPVAAPPVAVPSVTVVVPGTTEVTEMVTAPGSIAARRDDGVGVQGDGGRVTAVLVEPGQRVQRGQVLARIDRSIQTQQANRLAAEIRATEADAALADANLGRAQALVERGFISKADIDQRTASRDGARARVGVARAQLAELNARIAMLDVRSPANGLILARNVETGQVVGPGTAALFRLAENGVLEMRAQVAEQDMARLKPGMSAEVTPVGSTESYRGQIWLLDPVIDAVSRQGIARIALPYSPGLRVGAFARARVQAGTGVRPVLPQSAIQSDARGSFVYVIGADNKVARRDVTVGTVSDQGVSIASGLVGSERVVVSAGAFLRPGETVKPVLEGAAAVGASATAPVSAPVSAPVQG